MADAAKVNLVVVAEDERVHRALTFADKILGIERRRISSLDERFSVENRRTTLFFVQNRFCGLSGENLVEYLKSEYRVDKAKFFMVGNPSEMKNLPRRIVSRRINIDLASDKLADCLKDVIRKHAPDSMDISGLVTESVTISSVARKSAPVAEAPKAADTFGGSEFIRRVKEASGQFDIQHIASVERNLVRDAGRVAPGEMLSAYESRTRQAKGPSSAAKQAPQKVFPYTAMGISVFVVLLATVLVYHSGSKKVPAAQKASVLQVQADPLPQFVPVNAKDPLFSQSNPGWERYDGIQNDFRVYRENGKIKALHIIAKSGATIPDDLLAAAVGEKISGATGRSSAREASGSYTVERMQLANRREAVLYRAQSAQQPVAVAVKF